MIYAYAHAIFAYTLTPMRSFCPCVSMNTHSLHAYRLLTLFQLTNFTANESVHFFPCYMLSMNPGSYFNNNNSLLQNQAGRFKEKTMCYYTSLMHVHADCWLYMYKSAYYIII